MSTDPFADFNDSLDADFGVATSPTAARLPSGYKPAAVRLFTESCPSCNGTGRWKGIRPCFKCNSTGKLTFKSAPETRAKTRQDYSVKKEQRRLDTIHAVREWQADNAAEWNWIRHNDERGFAFATSLNDALHKYGSLTEGQLRAVRNCLAKEAASREARAQATTEIDVSRIQASLEKAFANFIKRPKLRLDTFIFSRAPDHGVNKGAVYVQDQTANTENGYVGKIVAGKYHAANNAGADQSRIAKLLAIAADPTASAIAYGLRTRNCACCGKSLVVTKSVDRGIGPICAEKYGLV